MQPFPVTESTLSAFHLGQFLQEKYGLSPKTSCKLFRTGINHLYFITDGERKFAFRIYTFQWRTKLEIEEELRLLNHLKENNISLSYSIADQKGAFIQEINAPEGIRFGALFSFADGEKIVRFTPLASYNIGLAMAKMHRVTAGFELKRPSYSVQVLLDDSLHKIRAFFTEPSDEMNFVEQATEWLKQEYKKVRADEIRHGAVHLDIWFDNLHFNDNDEATFFDFDFCGNGWLCYDVAYFMLQLYHTNPQESEYEEKMASFLKGYETIMPLSDEEKRIIPFIGIAIWFFYLGVQCERFDNWSNLFLGDEHLKRFLGIIRKWVVYNKLPIEIVPIFKG